MSSIDTIFTRQLLKGMHEHLKELGIADPMKRAWTYDYGRGRREAQIEAIAIPEAGIDAAPVYWHGRAATAYEARYNAWSQWLEQNGLAAHEIEDEDQ